MIVHFQCVPLGFSLLNASTTYTILAMVKLFQTVWTSDRSTISTRTRVFLVTLMGLHSCSALKLTMRQCLQSTTLTNHQFQATKSNNSYSENTIQDLEEVYFKDSHSITSHSRHSMKLEIQCRFLSLLLSFPTLVSFLFLPRI
jgi:hypothetical protein